MHTAEIPLADRLPTRHSMTRPRQRVAIGWLMVVAAATGAKAVLAEDAPQPRYDQAHGAAGLQQLVPETWGLVRVIVSNPTDQAVELVSSLYFDGAPNRQFARRIWLPARSRRSAWHPVLAPAPESRNQATVAVRSLLFDVTDGREAVLTSRAGPIVTAGVLGVQADRPITGLLADEDDDETRLLVNVARQSQNRTALVQLLRGDPLPPSAETLVGLDQLVVSSDRVRDDPAGLAAIRRWLFAGGRLWIRLDKVGPGTPAALLGDAFRCQPLDRTSLVDLQVLDAGDTGRPEHGPRLQFDHPVEMVRVLAPDNAAAYTVDGWPAAFWQRVGSGTVLFTTLGSRGWHRPRRDEDKLPAEALVPLPHVATEPLAALAAEFLRTRAPVASASDAWRADAIAAIGYQTTTRAQVTLILGGFCLALVVCGALLARLGSLAHLGWLGPLLACAAALLLASFGSQSRRAVPASVVDEQLVEVAPDTAEAHVQGLAAMYVPEPTNATLGARRGGVLRCDALHDGGSVQRTVWYDVDRWRLESVTLPAGVTTVQYQRSEALSRPITAQATFDAAGLVGELDLEALPDGDEAVLVAPTGLNMAVRLRGDGRFECPADGVLAPGQFASGAVLDDRQRRRQEILRGVLGASTRPAVDAAARLLVWTAPREQGFDLLPDAQASGTALLSIPLVLTRPATGAEIVIPAPLITYRAVASPDGTPVSNAYSNRESRWLGPMARGARTTLRFQLPLAAASVRPRQARLSLRWRAPGRELQVAAWEQGAELPLASADSVVGARTFELEQPAALALDDRAGLTLNINIGRHAQEATGNIASVGWSIDDVRLEVIGTAAEEQQP